MRPLITKGVKGVPGGGTRSITVRINEIRDAGIGEILAPGKGWATAPVIRSPSNSLDLLVGEPGLGTGIRPGGQLPGILSVGLHPGGDGGATAAEEVGDLGGGFPA